MYKYTWYQWLSFFYIYCFFGWIFESSYVSLKQRRFVNRGFSAASYAASLWHGSGDDAVGISSI